MYKDFVMQTLGIELAPLLSLVLFITVFGYTTLRAIFMSKAEVQELGNLPLDDSTSNVNTEYQQQSK
jgi:hypothetical protein